MTGSDSAENKLRMTTCDTSGWTLVASRNVTRTKLWYCNNAVQRWMYLPLKMMAYIPGFRKPNLFGYNGTTACSSVNPVLLALQTVITRCPRGMKIPDLLIVTCSHSLNSLNYFLSLRYSSIPQSTRYSSGQVTRYASGNRHTKDWFQPLSFEHGSAWHLRPSTSFVL